MIQSFSILGVSILGDGTSVSFSFDITKGPYNVNVGGNNPTGVVVPAGNSVSFTASLSGTKVTLTFQTAPSATPINLNIGLLYPGS